MLSDIIVYFFYVVIGVLTGVLSVLLGIGGGIIFIPTLFFTLPMIIPGSEIITFVAVSTSLFAGSFASSSASINHLRIKNIRVKDALILASGTIITSLIVPQLVVHVSPDTIRYFISIVLIFVGLKMLFDQPGKTGQRYLPGYFLFIVALFVGAISSVGGFGGGIFFVPVLHYLYGYEIKKAIGTSTLPVAVTMIVSTISYGIAQAPETFNFQLGYIHIAAGIFLGIGSVAGSFMGIKWVNKFRGEKLKKAFAILVLVMAVKLIF